MKRVEGARWKHSYGIPPSHIRDLLRRQADHLERPQFGEACLERDIRAPDESRCADRGARVIQHAAIDATAGEIEIDVRHISDSGEGVRVVAAATNVRENERDLRLTRGQSREVGAIGDVLRRPVATAMLPDVVEHRESSIRSALDYRIQERVVGATSGGEPDA